MNKTSFTVYPFLTCKIKTKKIFFPKLNQTLSRCLTLQNITSMTLLRLILLEALIEKMGK